MDLCRNRPRLRRPVRFILNHPDSAIIKSSRRKRIALGSGTTVMEVNNLLKQHTQMSKIMKQMGSGGGISKMQQRLISQVGGMQKFGR